jgi:hypothetical protein
LFYDEKDFYSKLEDFIEVCQARKENRDAKMS